MNHFISQHTIKYPCFKSEIVLMTHKDPYAWNLIKIFRKFEDYKFYPKISKTIVIKTIDHHSIYSINYAAAYYQTLEEVSGPLVPERFQKHEKVANILKTALICDIKILENNSLLL